MTTYKTIGLSSAHLSRETADYLDEQSRIAAACVRDTDPWAELGVARTETGWFVRVGAEMHMDLPADLLACVRYALREDAAIILFDADEEHVDTLHTFDW